MTATAIPSPPPSLPLVLACADCMPSAPSGTPASAAKTAIPLACSWSPRTASAAETAMPLACQKHLRASSISSTYSVARSAISAHTAIPSPALPNSVTLCANSASSALKSGGQGGCARAQVASRAYSALSTPQNPTSSTSSTLVSRVLDTRTRTESVAGHVDVQVLLRGYLPNLLGHVVDWPGSPAARPAPPRPPTPAGRTPASGSPPPTRLPGVVPWIHPWTSTRWGSA
jgi:hypothetical protein